ncbi:MFS transporter [Oscillospiraceae bacterium CM]|nr:MFS transporter [Oscillospiraceae bacterium CM]
MTNREKLWTPGFLVLWQSQLVSTVGDAVYAIALGFWVLATTGSTALMGMLMAASTLPGVLVSPFAGVLVDRSNKKRLMIAMDLIRGVAIVLLAAASLLGVIRIWMVFAAGIVLSLCGAVFTPGVQSSVPDIVPKSKISNANAAFSVVLTGANLIGNAGGGFLYQALGAPMLFLANGLSYLFSGVCLPFVKIPSVRHIEKPHFWKDMADGFAYMWRLVGLRLILVIAALINFFSFVAITLILPYCQFNPHLGAVAYGVLMACFMGGAVAGFTALSIFCFKPQHKMAVFIVSNFCCYVFLIIAVNQPNLVVMAVLLVVAGAANAAMNVLMVSTVQASTPAALRGKVMSFMRMTTTGLTPFAMALAGVLGGFLPLRLIITGAFACGLLVSLPAYFSKPFRAFLSAEDLAKACLNAQKA